MALTALSGFEPEWYYPELDALGEDDEKPSEDELTGFQLKPLTGPEYMEVLAYSLPGGGITTKGVSIALQHGLVGWQRFNGKDGQPLSFSRSNFDYIDAVLLLKLADKIMDISELTSDQKKT